MAQRFQHHRERQAAHPGKPTPTAVFPHRTDTRKPAAKAADQCIIVSYAALRSDNGSGLSAGGSGKALTKWQTQTAQAAIKDRRKHIAKNNGQSSERITRLINAA